MPRTPSVSVVVPTFNERTALERVGPRFASAVRNLDAEVLIVDDSSPDGTGELVERLGDPFRLVERPSRAGLASAVLDGFSQSSGEVVVVMDADGSHPPEAIPALVAPILEAQAEFVLASRRAPGGSAPGLNRARQAVSWGARQMARPLTQVSDPMSGFFAFRRSILARGTLDPIGYKIALEILVRCRPSPVVEVPFVFAPRVAGVSKLNGSQVTAYVHHVGRLYVWRLSGSRPATTTR